MKRNLVFFGAAMGFVALNTSPVTAQSTDDQANGPSSSYGKNVSGDGRYVAYDSLATNLVLNDTNGWKDVFVRDRQTGVTERVSVDSAGNQALGGDSRNPKISADGRYVVFASSATNLVPGDTNGLEDVFLHDRETGLTERISIDSEGNQVSDKGSSPGDISDDGRYVTFWSRSAMLTLNDTNHYDDVFVHDRETNVTERVSVSSNGTQGTYGGSWNSSMSADGRFVAFQSSAWYLLYNDTNRNGGMDIFVHDRMTGITERVSVDSSGHEGSGGGGYGSGGPDISADGRYVAFYSGFTNLVVGDTNGWFDVFVHDRNTGVTKRASVDSDGNQAQGGWNYTGTSMAPNISGNGRYVAFTSEAGNLVDYDNNGKWDIFVHDLSTGVTERVSVKSNGQQGSGNSSYPALDFKGDFVAFSSLAYNLVPNDTNGFRDIFVHDRTTGITERLTVPFNQPPTIAVDASLMTVDEGGLATNTGSYSDPDGDVVTFSASPIGTASSSNGVWSWSYQTSDDTTEQVTISADDGTEMATVDFQLIVNNVAPAVGSITAPIDPVPVGTAITASASFTDPGTADTHTATWDWGDGTVEVGTMAQGSGSGSVSGAHTYLEPGVYTIGLSVTDDDGGEGASSFMYVAVYDPNGSFVTGSGLIDSPAGAYIDDPIAAGLANFGFVSRYTNGASVPTGSTMFRFRAGSLHFTSNTYQWLVVAGARAQFKGTGTITDRPGTYGFLVTAIDGAKEGGGGTDKFRIKIWEAGDETVVYDNEVGTADDSNPTTIIRGGSIVISDGNNNRRS